MRCRVVVREIEAWLLAGSKNLARFLSVSEARIRSNPDDYLNPKEELINIVRRSPHKSVREAIVPRQGSDAKVGPHYVSKLMEFTELYWNPDLAAQHSNSLQRCINAISTLIHWQ
jgi:hypothetical protein